MAAAVNAEKFPLPRLPVPCSNNVLRTMSPLQISVFSLLSKKCKKQVSCFNYKIKQMATHFSQRPFIIIIFQQDILKISFYDPHTQEEMRRKKQLGTPNNVKIAVFRDGTVTETCGWLTNQLEIKEWVEHLQLIFPNCKDIWSEFSQRSFKYDLDSVKRLFRNNPNLSISHTGNFEYNQLILQKLLPTEEIGITSNCFRESRIPHRILIQNFTNFNNFNGPSTHISLNDLLMNNIKRITVPKAEISIKEFNKFLKLWIRGANPRMEYLTVFTPDRLFIGNIMKGIEYQELPHTTQRVYSFGLMKSLTLRGGFDIHRMDGTKATICHIREERLCLAIFVWYDHCIVS